MAASTTDKPKFTVKEQRFIDFYCGNATDAARKAGYKNPERSGAGNVRKGKIWAAIQAREEKEKSPMIASRQDRQKFWTDIMNNPEESLQNRLRASELLGKSEADFSENRNISGTTEMIVRIVD